MRIVLYIIWALFVVTAIYLLAKHLRQARRHEQQIAGWPKVQATVTGNVGGWTNGGGNGTRNRVFYPTYQFLHPNGALYAGESEVSYRNQQLYLNGQLVPSEALPDFFNEETLRLEKLAR